jgi:hypothetical protein
MSLLRQPPLELVAASARLEALRRRIRELAVAIVLLSAAGVASAATAHGQVATSLLFAAAVGVAVVALSRGERVHLLTRLVAQGDAERVPEAALFARELVGPARRARLARGLERAAAAGRPGVHDFTHVWPERAYRTRDELLRLASAFRDRTVAVAPASAALCRRMLCEAAVSPLYNASLSEEELARLLRAISAGVDR